MNVQNFTRSVSLQDFAGCSWAGEGVCKILQIAGCPNERAECPNGGLMIRARKSGATLSSQGWCPNCPNELLRSGMEMVFGDIPLKMELKLKNLGKIPKNKKSVGLNAKTLGHIRAPTPKPVNYPSAINNLACPNPALMALGHEGPCKILQTRHFCPPGPVWRAPK